MLSNKTLSLQIVNGTYSYLSRTCKLFAFHMYICYQDKKDLALYIIFVYGTIMV